ncbi:hypothetical protein BEN74_18625 [Acinetobacter sp. WCHAc010034]|uniref:hypothetical protein n=1 Tax=Acinetobacter sp. WCHAc010034 TaxID=1879049 RepID=UPI000E647242|nr:hypothetical protein [Acinetobacter sp. WCHAc010034]AYA04600.1 hypothetical protein BEN74_18625 [Acinetobacter sp. WCHAc010034]
MNSIISSSEAFNALMAGKQILCRPAGDMLDFDDLDRFPATIFARPGYEFCIKREMIELAGIQFTRPLERADAENGQDIFIVQPACIVQAKFDEADPEHTQSLLNGFVQADAENAKLQLRAIADLFGRAAADPLIRVMDKPKKQRSRKAREDAPAPAGAASNHAAKKTFENSEAHEAAEIETDPVKLVEKFTAQINACTQAELVLALRYTFSANGHLEREHVQHLCRLTELKLEELDPEAYKPAAPSPTPEPADLSVKELQRLQAEAEQQVEDVKQKAVLDDLLGRAASAKTPAEATALTGYTKSWTEEQRKPLVEAIHKRLNELNPPEAAEMKQPPSLLVQIQNAADLTELDCLEIETAGRHPDIQPKLMAAVKRRRAELENQAS